jgi:type IV secretory pathway component VirB8
MVVENIEPRVAKLEQAAQTAFRLLVTAVVLLVVVAVLGIVILVKVNGH